tara:strand:- start:2139 stop:2405 length:267 start_codon:yes stop_codon:yes gene_type:complete
LALKGKASEARAMEIDEEKVDEAVLALLYLTLHDEGRAWKSFDWDAMNRLHEKGLIQNPVGKAKSVVFTEKGLEESERLFQQLFARRS